MPIKQVSIKTYEYDDNRSYTFLFHGLPRLPFHPFPLDRLIQLLLIPARRPTERWRKSTTVCMVSFHCQCRPLRMYILTLASSPSCLVATIVNHSTDLIRSCECSLLWDINVAEPAEASPFQLNARNEGRMHRVVCSKAEHLDHYQNELAVRPVPHNETVTHLVTECT